MNVPNDPCSRRRNAYQSNGYTPSATQRGREEQSAITWSHRDQVLDRTPSVPLMSEPILVASPNGSDGAWPPEDQRTVIAASPTSPSPSSSTSSFETYFAMDDYNPAPPRTVARQRVGFLDRVHISRSRSLSPGRLYARSRSRLLQPTRIPPASHLHSTERAAPRSRSRSPERLPPRSRLCSPERAPPWPRPPSPEQVSHSSNARSPERGNPQLRPYSPDCNHARSPPLSPKQINDPLSRPSSPSPLFIRSVLSKGAQTIISPPLWEPQSGPASCPPTPSPISPQWVHVPRSPSPRNISLPLSEPQSIPLTWPSPPTISLPLSEPQHIPLSWPSAPGLQFSLSQPNDTPARSIPLEHRSHSVDPWMTHLHQPFASNFSVLKPGPKTQGREGKLGYRASIRAKFAEIVKMDKGSSSDAHI